MLLLHRLGRSAPFHLNGDLILTVEACPDTVVTLTTGARIVVTETADEVVAAVREWHTGIAARALATNVQGAPALRITADHLN
jgi:flagellar protein FlbD